MTAAPEIDEVEAQMLDDLVWFAQNPDRRYRLRRADGDAWIIFKHDDEPEPTLNPILVINLPAGFPDTDEALKDVWLDAARAELRAAPDWVLADIFAEFSPHDRITLAKAIRRGETLQ